MSRNAHASNKNVKEFNFKGSKEEFDAAGGNLLGMKSTNGQTLQEMFGGGAAKLSQTASGKASTITGNIQSGLQTGGFQILERLTPVLDKLVPASEKLAEKLPGAIDIVVDKFTGIWTYLQPGIQALKAGFTDLWQKSEPFRNTLANLGQAVLPYVKSAFEAIGSFIGDVMPPILDAFGVIIEDVVIPILDAGAKVIDNLVKPAFKAIGNFIRDPIIPIFKKLSGAIKSVVDFVGGITDTLGGWIKDAGNFFTGGSKSNSHATGLQRVPYDGYQATLHKDEAVIPAVSNPYNPQYKGSTGNNRNSKIAKIENVNIQIDAKDRDVDDVTDEMAGKLLLALENI